ncbi:MAG: prenyltransferase [Candidatus Methanomethylophilaceae archaeon]
MVKTAPVEAGWYNAFRPWTLHGAVVPVVLGGIVAFKDGFFNWWIFILVLVGGILLQSAANLLNTYGDFVKGTDTEENHSRSPELVSGKMRPKQILGAGLACLGITALIGVVFIWYIGWGILAFGILGIFGAGSYTLGVAYKYKALGQASTFFLMGILMPAGTYYVMTGTVTLEVILLGLPNAFTITGVLSGNETRDYHSDKEAGAGTLSGHMTYEGSLRFYRMVNALCYPVLATVIIIGAVPWTCVLGFAALIDYRSLYLNSRRAPEDRGSSFMLVPEAFSHNWHLGALLAIGYLIGVSIVPGLI